VAVGSAGSRIALELSKQSRLLEHFVFLTCDEADVANVIRGEKIVVDALSEGKTSPFSVRALATSKLPEIRQQIRDSQLVFVLAGLGGTVGSGLAPLVVREARSMDAIVVAIVIMPYSFDKSKHFFAGGALRQIRSLADGVIVIDNDQLRSAELPILDENAEINEKIALGLNKLLGSSEQNEISVALNNVVKFVRSNSYSVICLGESLGKAKEYREAVMNAARRFDPTVDIREASKSIVHLCTDETITMNELVSSIGGLSGTLGDGTMTIEYGVSVGNGTTTSAIIMATGFKKTRFDDYDPVDKILARSGKSNLDLEMDSCVHFSSLLYNMES
jgi:cell division protein FtsZ